MDDFNDAVYQLTVFIENDNVSYFGHFHPAHKKLEEMMKAGTVNYAYLQTLFRKGVDFGAEQYVRQADHIKDDDRVMMIARTKFPTWVRLKVAKDLLDFQIVEQKLQLSEAS